MPPIVIFPSPRVTKIFVFEFVRVLLYTTLVKSIFTLDWSVVFGFSSPKPVFRATSKVLLVH